MRFQKISLTFVRNHKEVKVSRLKLLINIITTGILSIIALFNNTWTLKLKAQPTNAFFAAVNQVFSGSSQFTTTAELCTLSELCTTI